MEGFGYSHNYDQIREIYGQNIALETDVPEVLAAAKKNQILIVKSKKLEAHLTNFFNFCIRGVS